MIKKPVSTSGAPAPLGPYSQGMIAGGFVFCSAQAGLGPASGKLVEGGVEVQTERVIKNLQAVLEAAGSSLDKVVKVTVYLQSMDDFKAMNGVYARFFTSEPPARAAIELPRLPLGALVGMECTALV
jgi:2-iminobutanoate/2-iminopropanoate deaminase